MKEHHQQQVFCHSNVFEEEAGLLFFEEKSDVDSNDPSNRELEISPLSSSVNRKDQSELSHSDPDKSVVIKHELHELTVSYEESNNFNVVKDICVDEGAKISIQDKNRDVQEDDDSKLLSEDQSKSREANNDVVDECTTKEKEDCPKISSEVDDSKGTAKDAFVESTNVQNSDMSGGDSCAQMSAQMPSEEANADKPNAEDNKASNYLPIVSFRDQLTDGEASFSAAGLVAYSGSISLRSDSSTTSTRSFAFPVLQSEWNGSPVRMAKVQKKKKGWRHSILCCGF